MIIKDIFKDVVLILVIVLGLYLFLIDHLLIYLSLFFQSELLFLLRISRVFGLSDPEFFSIFPIILFIYAILFLILIFVFRANEYYKWLITLIVFGLLYWMMMSVVNAMM